MREQNASATVYEMKDGEWKVVATSATAVRDTIQRIIGFRKDQFFTSGIVATRRIPEITSSLH